MRERNKMKSITMSGQKEMEKSKEVLMNLLGFKEIAVFHYGEMTTEDNELYALEKVAEFYKTMPNFIK